MLRRPLCIYPLLLRDDDGTQLIFLLIDKFLFYNIIRLRMHIDSKEQFDDNTIHLALILAGDFYFLMKTLDKFLSYLYSGYYK